MRGWLGAASAGRQCAPASPVRRFCAAVQLHRWIPRYLPEDVKSANKPGSLEGVRADSGVIFAKRPYILCVMTTYLRNERDGEEAIAQLSRAAYRTFDRLGRASVYGRVISSANSSK